MPNVLKSADAFGLDHEILSRTQMMGRDPAHRLDGNEILLLAKAPGCLEPDSCAGGDAEALLASHHEVKTAAHRIPVTSSLTLICDPAAARVGL